MSNLVDEQGNAVKVKDKREGVEKVRENPMEQAEAQTTEQAEAGEELNPIDMAKIEAMEASLPFAACRKCTKSRICPIPSLNNTSMIVPEPNKCWIELMQKDPGGRQFLAKLLGTAQNRYGLLMYELDSLEDTIEMLSGALEDSGRISLHGSGALSSLKHKYGKGRR